MRNSLLPAGNGESGPGLVINSNVCLKAEIITIKEALVVSQDGVWYMHFPWPRGEALVCPTGPQCSTAPC